jgi:predicted amidophosphoribosyltransferase
MFPLFTPVVRLLDGVLSFYFPPLCIGCRREGVWVCGDCFSELGRLAGFCGESGGSRELRGIISLYPYQLGLVREVLHALKYGGIWTVAHDVVAAAGQAVPLAGLSDQRGWQPPLMLLPVPTGSQRLKERGYNQAELLARQFSRFMDATVETRMLRRVRQQGSQVGRNAVERTAEVAEAFALHPWFADKLAGIPGEVILVDDVATTGSTLRACAAALYPVLGRPVDALVVARENRSLPDNSGDRQE